MNKRLKTLGKACCVALACWSLSAAQAARATPGYPADSVADLFYQVLAGEMYAQNGDVAPALAQMLEAARASQSPALYERAVGLALNNRDGEAALKAAQAWSKAQPDSRPANLYALQILLGYNRSNEAIAAMQRGLALRNPAEKLELIQQSPRYFARLTDKALAASSLEKALHTELSKRETGPAAWAAIGTMHALANNPEAALRAAQSGSALNPEAEPPITLALNLPSGAGSGVQKLLDHYFSRTPAPAMRMAYARKLLEGQQIAQARAQLAALTEQNPEFADGWLLRGTLQWENKLYAPAQTSLLRYLDLKKPSPSTENSNPPPTSESNTPAPAAPTQSRGVATAYLLLAQIAEQQNRYADADNYLAALEDPQDLPNVRNLQARMLAKQGKLPQARALIQSIPEVELQSAITKINLEVELLRERKEFTQAYEVLHQAIERFPDNTDFIYDLAMVCEKIDRLEEMEQLLHTVIAAQPNNAQAYNALGYSLADRNLRLQEAQALLRKAVELAPKDAYIADSLGWVEFRLGNLHEALRLLQNAYQTKPEAEIAAHLGEVLWNLQRPEQARAVWKEGQALEPHNEVLLNTLRRLVPQP